MWGSQAIYIVACSLLRMRLECNTDFTITQHRLESDVQELKADLQTKAEENKRLFLPL